MNLVDELLQDKYSNFYSIANPCKDLGLTVLPVLDDPYRSKTNDYKRIEEDTNSF